MTAVPEAASAPPLSSASIAPSTLSSNLLSYTPPHSTQTGDSNLVANTTIDSSHKETVPQQQGQEIDRPPSLLPLPVNGSGQPLLSPESTPSLTVQVLIDENSEEAVFEGQTMSLQDIVKPLQHPLSVLQKARSHVPASPPLVASDEMPPLELADRHPAPSQKLPTSKQPTPPAAPALAPPLSSTSFVSSPLSLNLLSYTLPHTLQTGNSNFVANTTIDSSHKDKVPQQQDQDLGNPTSNLVVKVTQSPVISPGHWGYVLKLKSSARAGRFVWKY